MFKSKKDIVEKFLKGKDWMSLNDIALGCDLPKTKTQQALYQLKYKNFAKKNDNGDWILTTEDERIALHDAQKRAVVQESTSTNSKPEQQEDGRDTSTSDGEGASLGPSLVSSENPQPKGLNEKLNDLNTKLDLAIGVKQKKEKKARLKKFKIGKVKRYNKGKNRAVILLSRNQGAKLVKGEFLHGMIRVVDKSSVEHLHSADSCFVWMWEMKQPIYIIPEWDIEPLSASKIFGGTVKSNSLIDAQRITTMAIEMKDQEAEEKKKGNMNWMMIIGFGVAGLVIAWLFFGGKK